MSLRRLFTWFVAATFIFNGAASLALIAVPAALAPLSEIHHAARAVTSQATHLDGRRDKVSITSRESRAQTPEHDDGCLKCCHMCSVASIVPVAPITPSRFSCAIVQFPVRQDSPPGQFVALDPGIPKSLI